MSHDASTTLESAEICAELATLCEGRASTYNLLARLYLKEVDEQLFSDLKSMRFPASTGNGQMDTGYRLIAKYLANAWENTLQDLAVDYVRTFLGSGIDSFSAAYPHESVYLSEKRLTMQTARDEVLAIYRAYGLDKNSSWKDGEDHIACELEFLRALSQRAANAFRASNAESGLALLKVQKSFLDNHLGLWTPMLTFGMLKFAKSDFYRGLSHLTTGFIEVDRAFLEEVVVETADEQDN